MDQNTNQQNQAPGGISGPETAPMQPSVPAAGVAPVNPSIPGEKTDTLGIVSIVLAFLGLTLIGIIVGYIGIKKAKEEGRSISLSRLGLIINATLLIGLFVAIAIIVFIAPMTANR